MISELTTLHDSLYDDREPVVVGLEVTLDLIQQGFIREFDRATECKAEQLATERLFVTVPLEYRSERIVQVGDDHVRVEVLAERLRLEWVSILKDPCID